MDRARGPPGGSRSRPPCRGRRCPGICRLGTRLGPRHLEEARLVYMKMIEDEQHEPLLFLCIGILKNGLQGFPVGWIE